MGFIKGTLTLTQYRIVDALPDDFRNFIDERIKIFAFRELTGDEGEKSVGWTSLENVLDTNFEYANYSLGEYLVFSLRIDRKILSPSLLKLKVLEAERKLMKDRGSGKLYKEQREEIRESVRLSLVRKTPPTPSIHEICWNVPEGRLLFGSLSEKVREDFEDLFKRTFRLTLRRLVPWDPKDMPSQTAERILSTYTANFLQTTISR